MAKPSGIYVCVTTFATGDGTVVHEGELIRKGHPLMKNRDHLFKPIEDRILYEHKQPEPVVEQATAAPGEKRKR